MKKERVRLPPTVGDLLELAAGPGVAGQDVFGEERPSGLAPVVAEQQGTGLGLWLS